MKELLLCIAVGLLGVIAYHTSRLPDADEIARAIMEAPQREASRRAAAREEADRRSAPARAAAERERRQQQFDALPKWDSFGRPINREPPDGLEPTRDIPPAPLGTYGNPLR